MGASSFSLRRFTRKVHLAKLLNQHLFSLTESDLNILNLRVSGIYILTLCFAVAILAKDFKGNTLS